MSAQERSMLEATLCNLKHDMRWSEIAVISDRDLVTLINKCMEEYE